MTMPKAYQPAEGYMYQILAKEMNDREWEHLDYAKDRKERNFLLDEYRLAYSGSGVSLKTIQLPKKYWEVANNE